MLLCNDSLVSEWKVFRALALQEYQFQIAYRKGALHDNADSLSRRDNVDPSLPTAATMISTGIPLQATQ